MPRSPQLRRSILTDRLQPLVEHEAHLACTTCGEPVTLRNTRVRRNRKRQAK